MLTYLKADGNGPSDLFTVVNGYLIGIYFHGIFMPSDHLNTKRFCIAMGINMVSPEVVFEE